MAQLVPKGGLEAVALHIITFSYWWGVFFFFFLLVSSTLKPERPEYKKTEIIQVSPFSLPLRLNGFASTTIRIYKIAQKYVKEKYKFKSLVQWN